jgi:hypothetical protein
MPDDLASESKQQRFAELRSGPYYAAVVAACRAYVTAAVPDAPFGAGERWVLTCLPMTSTASGHRRLCALSMANMETFVLSVDERAAAPAVSGFVTVRRSVLQSEFATPQATMEMFDLEEAWDRQYRAAGSDQLTLAGSADSLIRALANSRVAEAAQDLADFLARTNTVYSRYHNPYLTGAVIGD